MIDSSPIFQAFSAELSQSGRVYSVDEMAAKNFPEKTPPIQ
jgi:hypothetical protein